MPATNAASDTVFKNKVDFMVGFILLWPIVSSQAPPNYIAISDGLCAFSPDTKWPDKTLRYHQTRKARSWRPGFPSLCRAGNALVATAEQSQHEQEHIDKIEVQLERAHDCGLCLHLTALDVVIHFLDALGIVCRQPGKNQHTYD